MNIYLDYAATTPMDMRVSEQMCKYQNSIFGNPSSPHRHGQAAKIVLEECRDNVAENLGCFSKEVIFTSCGTESNNLGLIGSMIADKEKGSHIIVSAVEHPSVIKSIEYLNNIGFEISIINPDNEGIFDISNIEASIQSKTVLISFMYINNETGILSPVNEIGNLCKEKDIIFHCDAVQAFGKYTIDINKLNVDLLSFSGHKIYGPKGIGGLYVRDGIKLEQNLFGGEQEANKRPGTENMAGIVGITNAMRLFDSDEWNKTEERRNYFESQLQNLIGNITVIGKKAERSPYISNIAFHGIDNQSLLLRLDINGLSASVGSACSSGSIKQSHVLKAMGLSDDIINSSIRFSYGRFTELPDLKKAVNIIEKTVAELAN